MMLILNSNILHCHLNPKDKNMRIKFNFFYSDIVRLTLIIFKRSLKRSYLFKFVKYVKMIKFIKVKIIIIKFLNN